MQWRKSAFGTECVLHPRAEKAAAEAGEFRRYRRKVIDCHPSGSIPPPGCAKLPSHNDN